MIHIDTATLPNPNILGSVLQVASQRAVNSWPWYAIRGAGFAAAGLIVLLAISGIGQATGRLYKYLEPAKAWVLHKAIAIALCAAIVIHGGFLLLDHYVSFSLTQILVPFASHYNNGTKLLGMPLQALGITLGILAMYSVTIVVLSSLGWIDSKKRTWRWLHYLSYAVMFFVFLHAAYVGSDLKYGTFRLAWMSVGFILILAVLGRLWHTGNTKKSKQTLS